MLRRSLHHVAALDLVLDHLLQVVAVGVVVFLRLEILLQGGDQHLRHGEFLLLHQAGVGAKLLHLPDLVLVIHGVRKNPLGARPQHDDVLAIVHRHLGHAVVAGILQRGEQQRVRLLAALIRGHVVGTLQVDGVHLVGLDEFQDLHHLGGARRRLPDILVLDHHVAILLVLVALNSLRARDRFVFKLAIGNLLDARMVVLVQYVEADGFAARRAEQTDGKRHHAEDQVALPDACCHTSSLLAP